MSSPAIGPTPNQYAILVPIEVSDVSFIIGYLLNFGLFGVLGIQVFIYATRIRHDPRCLRFSVFFVFFLEVLNSALVIYSAIFGAHIRCQSCLLTGKRGYIHYGVPVSQTISTWAFQALCVLTGLSSSIAQAFFAWRIWLLGKSVCVPAAVIVMSLAQCILLMTGGIKSKTDPDLGVFNTDGAVIWLVISAACDILITVRTTQLLFRSRDESNCRVTQSLVRRLITMTIETGLVTVIATLLEFAIAQRLNIAHHAVFYFLSKLYANCLLATLNARLAMRDSAQPGDIATAVFERGDVQLTASDSVVEQAYGLGPEPRKTHPDLGSAVPMPPTGTGSRTRMRYRSVSVQSVLDMETRALVGARAGMKKTRMMDGGTETSTSFGHQLSRSESDLRQGTAQCRLSSSSSRSGTSTFVGSDWTHPTMDSRGS